MNKKLDLRSIRMSGNTPEIKTSGISKKDIAIIGMAGRIAGTDNLDEFWEKLCRGTDFIRTIPEGRKADIDSYIDFLQTRKFENLGGEYMECAYMDCIDGFDSQMFSISPREAGLMDPNQRIFLEAAWNAIEDSGYGGERLARSSTGVYVGHCSDSGEEYKRYVQMIDPSQTGMLFVNNLKSIIASRLSYLLDLRGPSMVVDTACSSSLLAVHLACQAIRNGECDMAVAGGVKINLLPIKTGSQDTIGIGSSDGRARTFDERSDGTGLGEGAAAIVIKPLGKALEDGDCIYAVIKGSAVNQDGKTVGITAPNSAAQEEVIIRAWNDAGVEPETITYIEAHGTGTKLGDPIEVSGISKAFSKFTQRKQFCAVGALKTNIGHLDNAAGIAGLIKAVLALKNKSIPANINFQFPNKKINFADSALFVNDTFKKWTTDGTPRRCGISAFGLSGTNCHMVLEEYCADEHKQNVNSGGNILSISAKSEASFRKMIDSYISFLQSGGSKDAEEVCYTANTGRAHYPFRAAFVFSDMEELLGKLKGFEKAYRQGVFPNDVFYGFSRMTGENQKKLEPAQLTQEDKGQLDNEVMELLKMQQPSEQTDRKELLLKLGAYYVKGANIPWQLLYCGRWIKKARVPLYQFDRKRCWFEAPKMRRDPELLHDIQWVQETLPKDSAIIDLHKGVLIIKNKHAVEVVEEIKRNLISKGFEVYIAETGRSLEKVNENFFITGNSVEDYLKLLKTLKDFDIGTVFYMPALVRPSHTDMPDELKQKMEEGCFGLFNFTKALTHKEVKAGFNLYLVTMYAEEITPGQQTIIAENASLLGIGKVIGQENEAVQVTCIDIDIHTTADQIMNEFERKSKWQVIGYRGNERYVQEIRKLAPEQKSNKKVSFSKDGVYLVTGGTRGIGLEIGCWLAREKGVNLALAGRNPLPGRDRWQEIIEEGTDRGLARRLKSLIAIEKSGAGCELYSMDIANWSETEAMLDELKKKYGKIRGIFHCAGVAGEGFIMHKDLQTFERVLAPKVNGVWILDRLTRKDNPDFFVMFSSFTSIAGAPGQSDYTAANSFLDGYAAYMRKEGRNALSINWTSWKDIGMVVDYGVNTEASILKPIGVSEGIHAMETVIGMDLGRVIIGEINQKQLEAMRDLLPVRIDRSLLQGIKSDHPSEGIAAAVMEKKEVKINDVGIAGFSQIQKKLAEIWGEVLGLQEVSIYDNFHDMGGDSINATRLVREINKEYSGLANVADVFSYPTISDMAEYLNKILEKGTAAEPTDDIDSILDKLMEGEISVGNAQALIEKAGEKEWIK